MTMKRLILMGANNPETLRLIADINAAGGEAFELVGWVDNDQAKHGTEIFGLPVLGAPEVLAGDEYRDCLVFNNITSSGVVRKVTSDQLADAGLEFATLVHPSVNLRDVTVGRGSCIHEGAIVQAGAVIKDHAFIAPGAIVCHETVVGRCVFVSSGATLSGLVRVGEGATIWAGATVAPRLTIGTSAQVGIGSAVLFDVPDGATVLGVPARELAGKREA